MSNEITYEQAGVNISEAARAVSAIKQHVKMTYRREVVGDIGGFAGLFSIAAAKQMQEPLLVSGTDGVGTKLQVANLAGKHTTIGIDLVAMCVNDILACGAAPLFFLDYIAIGKIRANFVREIVAGIARGCKSAGCALIGGEMAEHPGVMPDDEYDVSGFCVGIVDKPLMLNPENVAPGDVLIGLASSGLHSNGYSLVRRVCTESKTKGELLAPCDELCGESVLKALLEPTKIYVKPVLEVMQNMPGAIKSLAHITGGGITENLNRALNSSVNANVELGTWQVKPIIKYVCDKANLSHVEALKTFNMGLGMVLVVGATQANSVRTMLEKAGETTYLVGSIVEGSGQVQYANDGSLYAYKN